MLKVLHCADIHLDTPFTSKDAQRSKAARRQLKGAFLSLIDFIKKEEIPLALLAGDLFESSCVSAETMNLVCQAFSSVPFCSFVISCGNHDPYAPKSVYDTCEFPSNVHIFKDSELGYFDFEHINVRVYGYSFTSQKLDFCPFASFEAEDKSRINLLCGHGDIGIPTSEYCPITEKDIENTGFDYCAFGHVHQGQGLKYAGNVPYAYSGCLSGRDFGETGSKGAVLLTFDDEKKLTFEEKVFSTHNYYWETLDITGTSDSLDLRGKIRERLSGYDCASLVRIELIGSVPLELNIDCEGLSDELCSDVFYLEIVDSTAPLYDTAYLESDPTIVGQFYREMKAELEKGSNEDRRIAAMALKMGINALKGENLN